MISTGKTIIEATTTTTPTTPPAKGHRPGSRGLKRAARFLRDRLRRIDFAGTGHRVGTIYLASANPVLCLLTARLNQVLKPKALHSNCFEAAQRGATVEDGTGGLLGLPIAPGFSQSLKDCKILQNSWFSLSVGAR